MRGVDANETRVVQRLRSAELPRAMRGFQEEATRRLLTDAATTFQRLAEERDRLRGEIDAARAESDEDAPDAEAVGRALVVATSMSDQLVASAKEKAEHLVAEAEAEAERLLTEAQTKAEEAEREVTGQRDRLERDFAALKRDAEKQREQLDAERKEALERARDETERIVNTAEAEVSRLREEADGLRRFIEEKRNAFVGIAQSALEQLDRLEATRTGDAPTRETDELIADLHPGEASSEEAADAEPELDAPTG